VSWGRRGWKGHVKRDQIRLAVGQFGRERNVATDGSRRLRLRHPAAMLSAATAVTGAYVGRVGQPLLDSTAPLGIVSFELAGTSAASARIVQSWRERDVLDAARRSLIWDVPFTLSYSALLYVGVRTAGIPSRRRTVVAAVQILAGVCDLVEGVALWQALKGPVQPWPRLGQVAAAKKFAFIALGVVDLVVSLAGRRRPGRARK